MKYLFSFFILMITHNCTAQKMLVPYRSGKLFGLSDEKGKMVVEPVYDNVQWMGGSLFRTTKNVDLKDTLETTPGKSFMRNTTAKVSGLINNGKVIIDDEPFDAYEMVAGKCIVAAYEGRRSNLTKQQFIKYSNKKKSISLFNLDGKNLYPENFKRIQKMDTAGISSKHKNESRYILFWTIGFDDRNSLLVFDADKQEISEWLIKNAYSLKPEMKKAANQIVFSITDSNMHSSTQLLDYSNGNFIFQPVATNSNGQPGKRLQKAGDRGEVVIREMGSGGMGQSDGRPGSFDNVEVPREERLKMPAPTFIPYFIHVKDSLFYLASKNNSKTVKLPEGSKVILMEPLGMTQYQPVIVKSNQLFYIVYDENSGTTAYDSLIYFGKYFLAWKKINGQTKAGVINADGSPIIPLQYDSLYAGIQYFELVEKSPPSNIRNYKIAFREADSKYINNRNPYNRTQDNLLTAYIKDKAGVINIKGDIIIPFNYQMIATNNLQHSKPQEDNFILLKQNGLYGITTLKYNKEKKRNDMDSSTIAPIFEYIPGFYFPDYYGIKNLKLIGLYNDQYTFMGYATENGKLFYEK